MSTSVSNANTDFLWSSNFDDLQLFSHQRFKNIQHLILKPHYASNMILKESGKKITLKVCQTILTGIYYIKSALSKQELPPLYLVIFFFLWPYKSNLQIVAKISEERLNCRGSICFDARKFSKRKYLYWVTKPFRRVFPVSQDFWCPFC